MFIGEVWAPGLDPNVTYGPAATPAEIALAEMRAQSSQLPPWTIALALVALALYLGTRKR